MSPTFASLSIYNYRVYATGGLISNIGTWMGRVAQDWLVLTQLTDHSALALGVVTGLQFAPLVLLAPVAGMVADRFPKRRLLFVSQSALAVTAAFTGLLVVTGVVQLWQVYLLALVQGVATAVDNPARQTFVAEMVPARQLPNAVGLNSASFNAGRLIGPGVAGLVIAAIDTGPAFFLNSLSFVAVLFALSQLHPEELKPAPRARGEHQIRQGLGYVRRRPDLVLILALVFVLGTFGMNFQLTTALMATTVFHKGAGEYGLLGSVMAVGSLAAALLSARRPRPRLRIMLFALAGFTVSSLAAALATSYTWFAVLLVPVGLSALTVLTTANSTVQLSVDPRMRGRVMALYMAILMGGTPLGSPMIGWIGQRFGARWTILVGSAAVALSLVGASLYLVRSQNLRLRVQRSGRPHLRITGGRVGEPAPEVTA
ncbi:MAG TPA: MFS transporter [Dermatophilaceae bacterium]|nr:MFS transporter [Dermatophilaceae bacterium]